MGASQWVPRRDENARKDAGQSAIRYLLRGELVATFRLEDSADDRGHLPDGAQRVLIVLVIRNYIAAFFCAVAIFSCSELSGASANAFLNCSEALATWPVAM